MLSPSLFNSIDQILKTFKFNHEPFGGIQVILVGDFFQLPPISRKKVLQRFAFQTEIWEQLTLDICYLSTSHRHEDEILLTILNEMRSGEVSEESMEHFRGRYKKEPEGIAAITKLYTHNADVDSINTKALAELDAPKKIFEAHTTGAKKWLDRIFGSALVTPNLELKKGALVFFIKNNWDKGYINGTLGTVVDFDTFGTPIVETRDGRTIKADREEWIFEDKDGKPKGTIKQIPLRLAWAITVHKSQGMTLDAAEIDLSQAFEPGQGYVALSRIRTLSGLKLMGLNQQALQVDQSVLAVDAKMRDHSYELHEHVDGLEDMVLEERFSIHLQRIGGSVEKGTKKKAEAKKSEEPKVKSFLESKKFFERELSIAEVAEIRDLKEATIWNHLHDIINDDPEFDITYLQPDSDIIEAVEKAINTITKRKNEEDFSEKTGEVKLKPIFLELNEAIDYEDIKAALLFLE
jgi:ATP-dependent DNA helicase PIF1